MSNKTRQIFMQLFRSLISVICAALILSVVGGINHSTLAGDKSTLTKDKSTLTKDKSTLIKDKSTEIGNEKTYESLKLFSDVLKEIEDNYVDKVDTDALIHNAIKGMVSNLDPHSSFMPPEAFTELQDDTKGEFGGVGIVVAIKNGLLTVISPIEGTPAYKAGIKSGDIIIKIDGELTSDLQLWESVKKMRGAIGKAVIITIAREDVAEPVDYKLIRDIIPMTTVRSATLTPGYGYIWVTNFSERTANDIKEALHKLESGIESDSKSDSLKVGNIKLDNIESNNIESNKVPLKGLIFDLRNNPGGLLGQAAEVSDIFLDKGVIVSIKGRSEQQTEIFEANATKDDRKYPVAVLINGGTASASEIVAGALQDHKRALIIGTTSFGKGSVQSVKPLRDGYGLKYTIARYYTPNGRSIQAEGIKPDIEVPYFVKVEKEETENQVVQKKTSSMQNVVREKDLKNHLEQSKDKMQKEIEGNNSGKGKKAKEGNTVEKIKKPDSSDTLVDIEKLKKDPQVQRALDILVGYGVFSGLK